MLLLMYVYKLPAASMPMKRSGNMPDKRRARGDGESKVGNGMREVSSCRVSFAAST